MFQLNQLIEDHHAEESPGTVHIQIKPLKKFADQVRSVGAIGLPNIACVHASERKDLFCLQFPDHCTALTAGQPGDHMQHVPQITHRSVGNVYRITLSFFMMLHIMSMYDPAAVDFPHLRFQRNRGADRLGPPAVEIAYLLKFFFQTFAGGKFEHVNHIFAVSQFLVKMQSEFLKVFPSEYIIPDSYIMPVGIGLYGSVPSRFLFRFR